MKRDGCIKTAAASLKKGLFRLGRTAGGSVVGNRSAFDGGVFQGDGPDGLAERPYDDHPNETRDRGTALLPWLPDS